MAHKKKTLTEEEKKRFLSLTPDDITLEFFQKNFADHYNMETGKVEESPYNTFDEFDLKKGEYLDCDACRTNLGLFIFNKRVMEETYGPMVHYYNKVLDKKGFGNLQSRIAEIILEADNEEEICSLYFDYMDRLAWLAFTCHTEICASVNMKIAKPNPKVETAKKKLIEENREAFDNVDLTTVVRVQNELVDMAMEELQDDPAYELYASGARAGFDNAYRQAQIMKGPVYDSSTGKWDIIENSLYEGYEKKDIAVIANAVVDGCYDKAISTGECGYLTKKLAAGFQTSALDEKGTDCGTKALTDVTVTPDSWNLYEYHYVNDNGKLVRLDHTTREKYINKPIKMRLPGCCIGKKLCNICGGDRYYMMNMKNIGLTNSRLSNSLLRSRMKAAHDATVRLWSTTVDNCVL